jgi:hypothetical protein
MSQSLRRSYLGHDADEAAGTAFVFKAYNSRYARKKRIVFASPHVQPGLMPGTSLSNQDRPRVYHLPGKTLYP